VARVKEPTNPFYIVLVIVGVIFIVTASAFTLLLIQQNRTTASALLDPSSPLLVFVRRQGMSLMGLEVAVLGVASVCAMWLDSHRDRKAALLKEEAAKTEDTHER
jgi:uncharacterized protein YggT (Ycf19 family)